MTGKLLVICAGAAAADTAASGRGWASLLQQAAATITALTVLLGAIWWLVGPRIRTYLREQSHAARSVGTVAAELPAARADLAEQLEAVTAELARVRGQLHDHLLMAQGETRLVSELLIRAGEEHHHGRGT